MDIKDVIENKLEELRYEMNELRELQDEIELVAMDAASDIVNIVEEAKDKIRDLLEEKCVDYDDIDNEVEELVRNELDIL